MASLREDVFAAMEAGYLWLTPDLGIEPNGRWSDLQIASSMCHRKEFKNEPASILVPAIHQWRHQHQELESHKYNQVDERHENEIVLPTTPSIS